VSLVKKEIGGESMAFAIGTELNFAASRDYEPIDTRFPTSLRIATRKSLEFSRYADEDSELFLAGKPIGMSVPEMMRRLDGSGKLLNELSGHFSGLLLREGEPAMFFADRYGGCQWFHTDVGGCSVWATDWRLLPLTPDMLWDNRSWDETAVFRYQTEGRTLFRNISELPIFHIAKVDQGVQLQRSWRMPAVAKNTGQSMEQFVEETNAALHENVAATLAGRSSATVLLSGGVDSALLAAIARDHVENLTAISCEFVGSENPELGTAKAFAKTLNIEHKVIAFDEDRITADLRELVGIIGSPLRHYSTLTMHQLLASIQQPGEVVLYGETADTLFGSSIYLVLEDWDKQRQFAQRLPSGLLKLMKRLLTRRSVRNWAQRSQICQRIHNLGLLYDRSQGSLETDALGRTAIRYRGSALSKLSEIADCDLAKFIDESLAGMDHTEYGRTVVLDIEVPRHYRETQASASLFGLDIASPFHMPKIHDICARLPNRFLEKDGYTKPVLRELACRFYPRDLIYQEKWGFPVPQRSWLAGPLHELVSEAFADEMWHKTMNLEDYPAQQHFQFLWFVLNMYLTKQAFLEKT